MRIADPQVERLASEAELLEQLLPLQGAAVLVIPGESEPRAR